MRPGSVTVAGARSGGSLPTHWPGWRREFHSGHLLHAPGVADVRRAVFFAETGARSGVTAYDRRGPGAPVAGGKLWRAGMSPLALTTIETIPRVLLLVVGLLGLIFSIKGRARGVSGLMVGAFVLVLVTTAAGIAWQFVSLNAPSWIRTNHLSGDELNLIFLGVAIPLDVLAVISWLLVAIGVVKSGRQARQATGYPMAPQPGFMAPPPGYGQPQPGPYGQQPPN